MSSTSITVWLEPARDPAPMIGVLHASDKLLPSSTRKVVRNQWSIIIQIRSSFETIIWKYILYFPIQVRQISLRLTCSSILGRVVAPLLGEQLLRRWTRHAPPEYFLLPRFRNRDGGTTGSIVARQLSRPSSTIIPLLVRDLVQRVRIPLHLPRAIFLLLVDRVTGQGETMEEQIGIDALGEFSRCPPPIGRVERGVTAALHSPLVRYKCLFN